MVATRKSPRLPESQVYRMNSTWTILDDITVEGTIETPHSGVRNIPWKIVYRAKDKETNLDYGANEDYPLDEQFPPEGEDGGHDWEREIRIEAKVTKNNFFILNALAVPGKITADLTTPFTSMKRTDLLVDYTMTEDLMSWKVELKSDDRIVETSGSWSPHNYLPLEVLLTISDPGGQQTVFQSKMEPNETGVKVSVSLDSIGAEYRLDFDYELVMIERASFNLKVVTPIRQHELYSVKFDIRGDNGGGSTQLELETPFRKLENVKASAEWTVDVQLYKLSGKIDADSLSAKFRAGFIGNDGEMKANLLLEAADLCLYSLDVSSDADFNSVATNMAARWADEFNYAVQSKLERVEFSKLDWNLQLKSISEEENQWTLHFDLDIRDTSALYSHNLRYKVIHDQLDYSCYANVVTEGKERSGKVGIQWPSAKPLEADFTLKTSGKRMGKMNIILNTPWLEGPSAEIEVDINESQKPDIYKVTRFYSGGSIAPLSQLFEINFSMKTDQNRRHEEEVDVRNEHQVHRLGQRCRQRRR